MPKPSPSSSLDGMLLARSQDLINAQHAHADACLALAQRPNDPELTNNVLGLEQEIREHELTIQRLNAAKRANSEATIQQTETQRLQAARDGAAAVAATTPRIKAVLERVVKAFDLEIGPALAELDSLARERGSLTWAAAVSALGADKARRSRAALDQLQADTHLTSTLLAALLRSGLTQVGPRLDPWVTISPPLGGMGAPEQSLANFDKQAQRLNAFLADAIQQASNPQPVSADQE